MSVVSVTIHEAKDVRSADPNGFSDPYALVFVGKNKPKKTKIVKKNLSPKWEETFDFPLTRHDTTLQVQVWDWDAVGSDDFLGLVHIDLSPAHAGEPDKIKAGWLKLQPHPNKKIQVKGGIHITVHVKTVNYAASSSKDVDKIVQTKIRSVRETEDGGLMFDMTGVGATAFNPDWIRDLPKELQVISCGFNKLTALPDQLAIFGNLKQLRAAGNQVSAWPLSLCGFSHLSELELNGNDLRSLPENFGKLQTLEKLNLANNKLTQLPRTLGYCYRLEELLVSGNELETLPDGIGNCYRLELLDASCCAITSLPEELTYCTRLMELNLGGNRLQALPEAIGRLSRVVNLNISDNAIRDLPLSIGYCGGLAQIGQGLNIDRNPLKDPEMPTQYRIGADRLYMYLEKRMFLVGSPQLPPFPNNGRPPFVPLPPVDGRILSIGGGGAAGSSTPNLGTKNPRFGAPNAAAAENPASLKNRQASLTSSPAESPTVQRSSSSGVAAAAVATRDEKVEKIRVVAKAVIEQDIRPKVAQLKAAVDAAATIPAVQPLVLKVKSLKNDFEVIKTILPAIDKMPTPERAPNEDALVSLKKVVAVIVFEYDLVLGISLTVCDVASGKDLVTLVGALKKLKALLQ